MRMVDLFVEGMMLMTGCDKETAYKLAYDTCPPGVDPHEEVSDEEATSLRQDMQLVFGQCKPPTVN